MTKKMTMVIVAMLVALFVVGTASAAPNIDIMYSGGSVANGDTITLPVDVWADTTPSPDLKVRYAGGWASGDTYSIIVRDLGASTNVYSDTTNTLSGADPQDISVHWKPTKTGDAVYKITAMGTHETDISEIFVRVTSKPNITPELPTSLLLGVGLVGLVGMIRLKRKN